MRKIGWILLAVSTLLFAANGGVVEKGAGELVLGSFAAGLLLTFTPCVLPMVPILSSIIVGQGEGLSKTKSVLLSVAYVLGTAVTYALMGALAGATGEQLQAYFQNAWAIGFVSLIFVLMALSMFGLYTIALPASVQSRLNAASSKIKGGSMPMVFLMGMLSALVLGACVSPILIAFLGVAIAQGSAWLGAVTMFFMALGMGLPLILLGFGMGHLLPKAGAWMDRVKQTFGVLLLATAIYLFNTLELIPPLLVWGLFLIVVSIFLGAFATVEARASGWWKLFKGLGIGLFVWGVLLLVGAAYGQKDPLHPLPESVTERSVQSGTSETVAPKAKITEVKNLEALRRIQREAVEAGKLLVLFFHSDLCGSCKKIIATTFKDPDVVEALEKDYILVGVDITHHDNSGTQAIKKHFHVFGPPTFIFFDRDGNEIEEQRLYGYQDPELFLDVLELLVEE